MFATITDRDIRRAAVVMGAGHKVTAIKLQCSPRCGFLYPDTPEVRKLISDYDSRKILSIPVKTIMVAYGELLSQCKDLQAGRIGGGL